MNEQSNQTLADTSLCSDERDEILRLVRLNGERGAAKSLSVSRQTLVRCLAGLRMHRGTVVLVRARMRELRGPVQ